jgi:hypothetical protein
MERRLLHDNVDVRELQFTKNRSARSITLCGPLASGRPDKPGPLDKSRISRRTRGAAGSTNTLGASRRQIGRLVALNRWAVAPVTALSENS